MKDHKIKTIEKPKNPQDIIEEWKYYDYTCSLNHKHRICVGYNWKKDLFTIKKEEFTTKEQAENFKKEINNYLEKYPNCYICQKKMSINDLAGFNCYEHDFTEIYETVCQKCWGENADLAKKAEYISLEAYISWEIIDSEDTQMKIICPIFIGYPKSGSVDWEAWNDFDIQQINLFNRNR